MISVLTGDIVNSRKSKPDCWLDLLKLELNSIGNSPLYWEIYGGDTFQVRVDDPLNSLFTAFKIKSLIKTVNHLDVRISIGIGEMSYQSERITECNGPAYIYSGEKFDLLKKEKQKLAVKTAWPQFDEMINVCLKLGMIAMDRWSVNAAEVVSLALSNPLASQSELGKILGNIRQNAVSSRLSRAHFDELLEINELYKNNLRSLL